MRSNGRGSPCSCGRSAVAAWRGLPDAARGLFARALAEGWDKTLGGVYYTLEWNGAPRVRDRLWWPVCEGIGAATFPRRARRRRGRRSLVSAPVGLRRAPFHRSARRRLAAAARRFAQADRRLFRRQARPLSRAAGVPDPALSDRRVADARNPRRDERAPPERPPTALRTAPSTDSARRSRG